LLQYTVVELPLTLYIARFLAQGEVRLVLIKHIFPITAKGQSYAEKKGIPLPFSLH